MQMHTAVSPQYCRVRPMEAGKKKPEIEPKPVEPVTPPAPEITPLPEKTEPVRNPPEITPEPEPEVSPQRENE